MKAHWIKIITVGFTLPAVLAGCSPQAFPGTFHGTGAMSAHTLEFRVDGTLGAIDDAGVEQDTVPYKVSGSQIVLGPGGYCGTSEGTYAWIFDGKTLKLTAVSDDCGPRKDSLLSSDWIKE